MFFLIPREVIIIPTFNTNSSFGPGVATTNQVNRWTVSQNTSMYTYSDRSGTGVTIRELARRIFGLEVTVDEGDPFTIG